VTSGTLPTGTSLAPSTGIISGTVTTAGSYSFTITATDANAIAGSRVFQIAVLAPAVSNYGFVA
jgi:hypothetical protein